MSPLLQQGLLKVGVTQTYPRALVHCPLQYGRLNIPNLASYCACAHNPMIQPSMGRPHQYLLHATVEAMQLEMGYSEELLQYPLCLADNVTKSWIKQVWNAHKSGELMLLQILRITNPEKKEISNS